MKTVEVEPLDRWGWDCPDCWEWNELDISPECEESITCDGCGKDYEPDVQR